MFESLKHFVARIRAYDEPRRRKIVFMVAGVLFLVICVAWIAVISSGFVDFSGHWISGTRTYTASGTQMYDDESASSVRSSWESTQERIGEAWNTLMRAFNETSTSATIATSTPATTTDFISSSTQPSL